MLSQHPRLIIIRSDRGFSDQLIILLQTPVLISSSPSSTSIPALFDVEGCLLIAFHGSFVIMSLPSVDYVSDTWKHGLFGNDCPPMSDGVRDDLANIRQPTRSSSVPVAQVPSAAPRYAPWSIWAPMPASSVGMSTRPSRLRAISPRPDRGPRSSALGP